MNQISKPIAARNLRFQSWINFISGVTFLVPVVTLLYQYSGLGLVEITLISNVYTACVWLFELPTSVLADTTGRKLSMMISVSCNLAGALLLLFWPSFWGFILASVAAALYLSFWSGTGQAFLDENLRALGREKEFGKIIGSFMFYGELGGLITPLFASGLLFVFGNTGYTVLAALDVVSAVILLFLVYELKETAIREKFTSFRHAVRENLVVAREAVTTVWGDRKIRLILLYRTFTHHVGFLPLILLPILTVAGMPAWLAGGVITAGTLSGLLLNKYAYKFGDRFGYGRVWVWATTILGILLLAASVFVRNWTILTIIYVLFTASDGLRQPIWNHVLVGATSGRSVATIRSLVVSVFALYVTVGKQIAIMFPLTWALAGIGVVMLAANVVLGRRIAYLED